MTESQAIVGIAGMIIGFMGNLVLMRAYFCSGKECELNRVGCEKERIARWEATEQRWEEIDGRLSRIEHCVAELKLGWKENYKEVCAIKAIVQRQSPLSGV